MLHTDDAPKPAEAEEEDEDDDDEDDDDEDSLDPAAAVDADVDVVGCSDPWRERDRPLPPAACSEERVSTPMPTPG